MTSHKIVMFLLLVLGASFGFDLSAYTLPGESNVSVSYTNFTFDNTPYSIVALNGADTFLLKNGTPISNQSEIESVLHSYYVQTYSANQTEIDQIKSLITQFNNSRNDGYDFKGKEEYLCRNEALLSNGKITISGQPIRCVDNTSCAKNALILFSIYSEGLNLGSASVILTPLMDFTLSSIKMDQYVENYTTRLNNPDPNALFDTLEYIKSTTDDVKALSLKIESTPFRTPRLNDSADRKACERVCWGICPSFELDQPALDLLKSKSSALSAKIAPLKNYQGVSTLLYNRTNLRLEHLKNDNTAAYYLNLFKPSNSTGTSTISFAEGILKHVQNKSMSSKLDDLKSLHSTIPEDIEDRNFTNIDSDLIQYQKLTSELSAGVTTLLSEYNETITAKNTENSLLILLESKDLDPVSTRSLELIKNKSSDLDAQFRDGLTLTQLQGLESNYSSLGQKCQELLKSESESPTSRVLLLLRGFSRRVNTGIAQVVDKTHIMPKSDVPDSPVALGAFSGLVFVSLSSLALLVFLYIFAFNKFTIPKTSHIMTAAFVVSIILIFVFSVLLYLFLGKTSTDATLPEFLSDFDSKSSASILVDLRNATFSDSEAMRSCASSLATTLAQKNKSWTIYTLTPTSCTMANSFGNSSSLAIAECFGSSATKTNQTNTTLVSRDNSAESNFILLYSPKTQAPKFSIIYESKAEIKANTNYYESCPLVALFS